MPHFGEYAIFGALFVVLSAVQGVWAVLLLPAPHPHAARRVAVLNAGVLLVWVVSRSVGLPVGPGAGAPEPIGLADSGAGAAELAMVIGFALTLRRPRRAVRVPSWARGLAIVVLVFAGATLPTAGTHRHSSPELEHTH